jgi:hypothetical protein
MINIKKGISYFLYLFYTAVIIFSQTSNTGAKMSLEELYGPQTANILRSEGKIMYVPDLKKGEDLKYFLKTPLVLEGVNRWYSMKQEKPVFEIEAVYLIDKPVNERNTVNTKKTAGIMTSLSKMKGIMYYSNTWKKYEVLYEESHLIDSYEAQNKIMDPVYSDVDGLNLFVKQKDNSYGEYVMEMDYSQSGNEISFYMINKDPLKFLFFKALEKENMHVFLHTLDIETHIIAYLLIRADYFETALFTGVVEKSLTARIDAICKWFIDSYNEGGQQ